MGGEKMAWSKPEIKELPESEALQIHVKDLFKRCHVNALGNQANSVKADVDQISALLAECRDAVIQGHSHAWAKDCGIKVGDPIFLVGKTLDGRIIRAKNPIPLPSDPVQFMTSLEGFLDRDLSKKGPSSESKARENKEQEVGVVVLIPSEEKTKEQEGSPEEGETQDTWWSFGSRDRGERGTLDRIFGCHSIDELAAIPVESWKDDERLSRFFFSKAHNIFEERIKLTESATPLINLRKEITSFIKQFVVHDKNFKGNLYRDPMAPNPEHQFMLHMDSPLVDRLTSLLTQYIRDDSVTIDNLNAMSRTLRENEWIYSKDILQRQINERMAEIRFKPQPRR